MSFIALSSFPIIADTGSQLQQYASLLAIAKRTSKEVVFFKGTENLGFKYRLLELLDIELKWVEQDSVQ